MDSPTPEPDDALIARAAWLYYNEGLTQGAIGDLLNLSRIKVSRLLDQGREAGLIQIRVNSLHHGCLQLELALQGMFGLSDCRVVPSGGSGALNPRLGEAAAQYLMQKLQPGEMLAVGWGETVSLAIRKLGHFAQAHDIGLVTLTGGVQSYVNGMRSANWGPQVFVVPAPLVASTPELGRAFAAEASVGTLLEMARRADYKLVGIGGLSQESTVVAQGVIAPAEVEPLRRMDAAGDILCRFFDHQGAELDLPLHGRVIGLELSTLKASGRVIGVAGGPAKVEAIRAALSGKLTDILITDEATAAQLVNHTEA